MKRISLAVIALLLAIIACGPATTPTSAPPSTDLPVTNTPTGSPQFTIAIEYAIPGVAAAYAPTCVTYAKP